MDKNVSGCDIYSFGLEYKPTWHDLIMMALECAACR